jgi:FKBP-type peptidyl-prolyl cis-trans isomerase FkpA
MRSLLSICIIVCIILVSGCQPDKKRHSSKDISEAQQTLVKINKALVINDREVIESYIKRQKLDSMKESGSGLYYFIWGNPKGDLVKTGNVVEYNYKISMLDGTVCYQSEAGNPKKFKVGLGGVESGLEQAVLLMCQGQKGIFILPPHLAYGLLGDEKMIPSRSIIVYEIEMLNVYR